MQIPLEQLEEMFDGMRAQTPWNVDGSLLWGYFFTDRSSDRLKEAATYLSKEGYRFVGIHRTEDGSHYVLHVERVEVHSPQTLHARNEKLDEVAAKFDLASYDGMDVGPLPA